MFARVNRPIDVFAAFETGKRYPILKSFRWERRRYDVSQINSVHRERDGETVSLCYAVSCGANHFSVRYNTQSCQWVLDATFDPD